MSVTNNITPSYIHRLYVLAHAPSVRASPPVLVHGILMGVDTEIRQVGDASDPEDASFVLDARVFYGDDRTSSSANSTSSSETSAGGPTLGTVLERRLGPARSSGTAPKHERRSFLFKASSGSQRSLWLAAFRQFIWEAHKSEAGD